MGISMSVTMHNVPEQYINGRKISHSYKDDVGDDVIFYTAKDNFITYFF